MAKTSKKTAKKNLDMDGIYLLKIVLYVILGSLWLKASNGSTIDIGLPVGFIVGCIFASHEHFRIDRKIEYAVLLVAMLFGYFAPYGLYVMF